MSTFKTFLNEQLLLERGAQNVIDREDLIFLQSALDKYEKGGTNRCFIDAVIEAVRLASDGKIKLNGSQLEELAGDKNKLTRRKIQDLIKSDRAPGGDKYHRVKVKFTRLFDLSQIKTSLRKGFPVILVINISDIYWDWFGELAGWRDKYRIEEARRKWGDEALTQEFLEKVGNGIIPFPTDKMIEMQRKKHHIKHSFVTVGYDAGDKALICKDTIVDPGKVKFSGLFKLDEKFIGAPSLHERGIEVIEYMMNVGIESTEEDPKPEDLSEIMDLIDKAIKIIDTAQIIVPREPRERTYEVRLDELVDGIIESAFQGQRYSIIDSFYEHALDEGEAYRAFRDKVYSIPAGAMRTAVNKLIDSQRKTAEEAFKVRLTKSLKKIFRDYEIK